MASCGEQPGPGARHVYNHPCGLEPKAGKSPGYFTLCGEAGAGLGVMSVDALARGMRKGEQHSETGMPVPLPTTNSQAIGCI